MTTMLDQRSLGRSGLRVTGLGYGAASIGNLGRPTPADVAEASVHAAWEAGVRYFDTAPHYGLGLSEQRLGAALRDRPRDQYVLSTKVGRLLDPHPRPTGSDLAAGGFAVPDDLTRVLDYSRDGVLRSLEASLRRLGVDRVDIVLVHDPDDFVDQAVAEAVPALVELREQGVVGAVGVGMNQWQAPLRILRETDLDVVMVAGRWTLFDRGAEPLLEAALERGVGILAASPFNSGLLSRPRPADDAWYDYGQAPPEVLARARALADICARHGAQLPHAALQFPLRHPAVSSVVNGLRTPENVASSVGWLTTALPAELWKDLD